MIMQVDFDDDSSESSYESDRFSSEEESIDTAVKALPTSSRTISIESGRTGDVSSDESSMYSSSSSEVSGFDSSEDDTLSSGDRDDSSTGVNVDDDSITDDVLNESDSSLELLVPTTKAEILPNDTPQMNDSLSHIPSLLDNEGGESDDEEDLLSSLEGISEHMPCLTSDEEDAFDTESSSNHSDGGHEKPPSPKRKMTRKPAPKLLGDDSSGSDSSLSFDAPILAPPPVAKSTKRPTAKRPTKGKAKASREKASALDDSSAFSEKAVRREKKNDAPPPVKDLVIDEKLAAKQAARAARMEKVKARIAREKQEKEQETKKKKEEEVKVDFSEQARRERAYSWYTRSAMPNRDKFKEKVRAMPLSTGITEDDVDLLPWNAKGTMVNVAKMNSFLFKR